MFCEFFAILTTESSEINQYFCCRDLKEKMKVFARFHAAKDHKDFFDSLQSKF